MYVCIRTYKCKYIYICIYALVYTHACVYTCTYIYTRNEQHDTAEFKTTITPHRDMWYIWLNRMNAHHTNTCIYTHAALAATLNAAVEIKVRRLSSANFDGENLHLLHVSYACHKYVYGSRCISE